MSAGAERVNVLAVMDRAIERNRERGAAIGSPSDRSLREARDAVRELIASANTLIEEWDRQDNGRFDGMTAKAFFAAESRFREAVARAGGAE